MWSTQICCVTRCCQYLLLLFQFPSPAMTTRAGTRRWPHWRVSGLDGLHSHVWTEASSQRQTGNLSTLTDVFSYNYDAATTFAVFGRDHLGPYDRERTDHVNPAAADGVSPLSKTTVRIGWTVPGHETASRLPLITCHVSVPDRLRVLLISNPPFFIGYIKKKIKSNSSLKYKF